MKFYAAVWREDEPTAGNLEWFTSRKEADREARSAHGRVFSVEIEPSKQGLLKFLHNNAWRSTHLVDLRLDRSKDDE